MSQTTIFNLPPAPTFFPAVIAEGPQDSDFALARAAAGGATDALSELYLRHHRRVHLLGQVGSFRGDSLFTTWLHRLTINLVLMSIRRDARRRGLMPDYIQEQV